MTWDLRTGRFYISSTYLRKISQRDKSARFRDFTRSADHGMWQALGMKIDLRRRWLLVCTGSDDSHMTAFRREDLGKSGVFIYSLDSGVLVARHVLAESGVHLFNDLVLGRGNKSYITDSDAGTVYALDLATGRYTRMAPAGTFLYPNGIAISPGGTILYVAGATGIDLVDIATSKVRRLPHPHNVTTVGIDGLYFYRGYLIATQTDVKPNRIMAFHLAPSLDRIDAATVLERADPRMTSPTEGTIVGNIFYFIANSQQNAFDSTDHIWSSNKLDRTIILKLKLPNVSQ